MAFQPPQVAQQQVQITTEVVFVGCAIQVHADPRTGGRQIVVIDPASGTAYRIPLDPIVAMDVGKKLMQSAAVENGQ